MSTSENFVLSSSRASGKYFLVFEMRSGELGEHIDFQIRALFVILLAILLAMFSSALLYYGADLSTTAGQIQRKLPKMKISQKLTLTFEKPLLCTHIAMLKEVGKETVGRIKWQIAPDSSAVFYTKTLKMYLYTSNISAELPLLRVYNLLRVNFTAKFTNWRAKCTLKKHLPGYAVFYEQATYEGSGIQLGCYTQSGARVFYLKSPIRGIASYACSESGATPTIIEKETLVKFLVAGTNKMVVNLPVSPTQHHFIDVFSSQLESMSAKVAATFAFPQ